MALSRQSLHPKPAACAILRRAVLLSVALCLSAQSVVPAAPAAQTGLQFAQGTISMQDSSEAARSFIGSIYEISYCVQFINAHLFLGVYGLYLHIARLNDCREALTISISVWYELDPYRHCIWAALLTIKLGNDKAKQFTFNHEVQIFGGSNEDDTRMDFYNNTVGHRVGEYIKSQAQSGDSFAALESRARDACSNLWSSGSLATFNEDGELELPSRPVETNVSEEMAETVDDNRPPTTDIGEQTGTGNVSEGTTKVDTSNALGRPTVTLSVGDSAVNHRNCPEDARCYWFDIELEGFGTGPYEVKCATKNWTNPDPPDPNNHEVWRIVRYDDMPDHLCYYFREYNTVYVIVDGVRSNDLYWNPR